MQRIQRAVLSFAGLDPSAGAGLLADIKTFEQIGVYGVGVATCITYQSDQKFNGVKWLDFAEIEAQFIPLGERFDIGFVKIGMVENMDLLEKIIRLVMNHNPKTRIIWDPVLKTSSGFSIHADKIRDEISDFIDKIYLLTPNAEEAEVLEILSHKTKTNILLKGGHQTGDESIDTLYTNTGNEISFVARRLADIGKHGSGCVLSAAITAFLNNGLSLEEACRTAKDYTFQFLTSADGLFGFHHNIEIATDEIPY